MQLIKPEAIQEYATWFPWARLIVDAEVVEGTRLMGETGSTLRSAVALAVKELVCVYSREASCEGCTEVHGCPFPIHFEATAIPEGPLTQRTFVEAPRQAPRPRCPVRFSVVHTGEIGLHLVQRAVESLAHRGLGDGRGRIEIRQTQIQILDVVRLRRLSAASEVRLSFETPLHLKRHGQTVRSLTAEVLCRAVHRRVRRVAAAIGYTEPPHIDELGPMPAMCDEAIEFRTRTRRSATNPNALHLGGWTGHVTLKGHLERWAPWLVLAEALHVGRHISFGQGRVKVSTPG